MPAQSTCVMTNIEQSRLTAFVTIVTDLLLLLIMFVGSLRLRRDGGGTFGLAGLLWRQVRVVAAALVRHGAHNSLTCIPIVRA